MQMKYGIGTESRHNLDSKKRIFVPARIRDLLGRELVITCDMSLGRACLGIYSVEGWDQHVERALELCESEEERQDTVDELCFGLIAAELDDQGRVTLTKQLIEYAELEKEVVVTGSGDHALIWNAAIYDEMRSGINHLDSLKAILGRKRPGSADRS